MTCGIYCITNTINRMQYVGQSESIERRFKQHIESPSSSDIHQAIEKYGAHNFRFEIIVACHPNELDEQEVKFIRLLNTYENGYNQTRGGQHSVFSIEKEYEDKYSIEIKSLKKRIRNLEKTIKTNHKCITQLTNENEKLSRGNVMFKLELDILKDKLYRREDNCEILKEVLTFEKEIKQSHLDETSPSKKLKDVSSKLDNNIFIELLSERKKGMEIGDGGE